MYGNACRSLRTVVLNYVLLFVLLLIALLILNLSVLAGSIPNCQKAIGNHRGILNKEVMQKGPFILATHRIMPEAVWGSARGTVEMDLGWLAVVRDRKNEGWINTLPLGEEAQLGRQL